MEGLAAVDQKGGYGQTGGTVRVLRGRVIRLIDLTLDLAIVSLRGENVWIHHAHTLKLGQELRFAHWTFADGVLAVASHAVPPV
jgi:hypothetical protein